MKLARSLFLRSYMYDLHSMLVIYHINFDKQKLLSKRAKNQRYQKDNAETLPNKSMIKH